MSVLIYNIHIAQDYMSIKVTQVYNIRANAFKERMHAYAYA